MKKIIRYSISVSLLLMLLFLSFRGCDDKSVTDINENEAEVKRLQNDVDSLLLKIGSLKNELSIFEHNENIISEQIQIVSKENTRLKADFAKSKLKVIEKNVEVTDTSCLIAISDCELLANGLENEIILRDSIYNNQNLQISNLKKINEGCELIGGYMNQQITAKDEIIRSLKKSNPKFKLYLGAFGGFSVKNALPEVGISSDLQIKNAMIGYRYGALGNYHAVSFAYKISFRRK